VHYDNSLNGLWEVDKGRSAHKPESMAGKGEPANSDRMPSRFKTNGWA
jgi:hypothetical protein